MENQAAGGRRQAAAEKLVRRLHENGWLSIPTERDIPEHQFRFLVGQVLQAAAQVSAGEGAEPAGAFDALLASYNTAALFVQYRNQDGSVTLTAAEAERVGAKVTAALKLAATRGFPWLVMLGDDQIVAGFFSEVGAAAYINLSRESGKYRLVNRDTGVVDGAQRASSVATMPDPASLTDQPRHGAKSPDHGVRNTTKNMPAPEAEPGSAAPHDRPDLLARVQELAKRPIDTVVGALMETYFAYMRGMKYAMVDTRRPSTDPRHYVGAFRTEAAARAAGGPIALAHYELFYIEMLIDRLERHLAEQQTG